MAMLEDPTNYESAKPKLGSAAIIGHTDDASSRIWIRAYRPGTWWLLVTKDKLNAEPTEASPAKLKSSHVVVFAEAHDFDERQGLCHCFQVRGLKQNRRYFYYLIADDGMTNIARKIELGTRHQCWFQTLAKYPQSLRFGFCSCHDPYSAKPVSDGGWRDFHEALEERNAHFVIGGGDQAYCDSSDKSQIEDVWNWLKINRAALLTTYTTAGKLDEVGVVDYLAALYRTYYCTYWAFENVQNVYRRFPQYMIWDDHEIMDGWGSLTRQERRDKIAKGMGRAGDEDDERLADLMFLAACRTYQEYQHSHNPQPKRNDPRYPANCQWDYGFHHGKFAFYVLDLRGHHDCERDSFRLLGLAQFERFKAWIRSGDVNKAEAVFVVSPVPIVHWNDELANTLDIGGVKDDFMDEWGHDTNQAERNKLLDLLFAFSHLRGIPVSVLSGDVHCASAFRIIDRTRYENAQLFNITSSAISRKPPTSKATMLIASSGKLKNHRTAEIEKLHEHAGNHNFAMLSADMLAGELRLGATLYTSDGSSDGPKRRYLKLV